MRIILKQEVDNLGLAGDVVEVADGYARNYLIPRELAIKATRGALKQAELLTRARKAQEAKTLGAAEQYREVLESRALRIPMRVDERGHLYGSVGPVEVQKALTERGHDIERRRIDLKHPIKEIGSYSVTIRLHPQVSTELPLEVVDAEGRVSSEEVSGGGEGPSVGEGPTAAAETDEAAQPEPAAGGTREGSEGGPTRSRRSQQASEQET
ncbi:MAG: 50S ribosomal protein L9 [Actinomycetota bacterium]|nr:50S ribosomal protein L9 [Actinomycetota bacterium]